MLRPDSSDYRYMTKSEKEAFRSEKMFSCESTELPFDNISRHSIKKKWRPAGFHAQRVAAMGMIAAERTLDPETGAFDVNKIHDIWPSALFVKGCAYFNRTETRYMLSLGFMEYGCIAVPLQKVVDGDDVTEQ